MGGGVAGAIKRAGGSEIEEAIQRAPISVGEAVATTAGRLRARYVIHAPTMSQPAMSTDTMNVEKATTAALGVAKQLGLSSAAIPGMGTGVGGVPVEDAARLILSSTEVGRFMLPLWSSVGWTFRCCGSTCIHPSVEA